MTDSLERWMRGYVEAWSSNDEADIAALFTEDAIYDPQTKGGAWEGRDAIVAGWIDARDEPDSWAFQWEPLCQDGDRHVIVGTTTYDDGHSYRNLWVIDLDGERCRRFTEWWMKQP